jgi:hypothetical protein
MSSYLAGQMVGAVAVIISLAVYQVNNRSKMLGLSTISATLYAIAFFLIHAYTGAALNFIGGMRCASFMRSRNAKDSIGIYVIFAAVSCFATAVTWSGPVSLLALGGTLLTAASSGQLRTRHMRRVALLAPPLWFTYNVLTAFYPGMFIESFVIVSNLIGQYRFDIGPRASSRPRGVRRQFIGRSKG